MSADTSDNAAAAPSRESAGDSQALAPRPHEIAIEDDATPGTRSLRMPPAPAPRSAATARRGNPGSQVREWKIDVQPSRASGAFCPRCNTQFVRGAIRIGSAAKGGKAHLHIACADASLPTPAAFRGWHDLSPHQQHLAREQLEAHAQARGGDATDRAPKRIRRGQPPRLRQLQLAFAPVPMPRAAMAASVARAPEAEASTPYAMAASAGPRGCRRRSTPDPGPGRRFGP